MTRVLRSIIAVVAVSSACASSKPAPRAPASTQADTTAAPRALAGLATATRALGAPTATGADSDVAAALTALAEAMDRDPALRTEAESVRALGARLASAPAQGKDHARIVRRALDTAGNALENRARTSGPMEAELTAALAAAETAVSELADTRALADQRGRVVAGFQAITDVVFLLQHRRAPFPLRIASAGATQSPAAALVAARRDALAIARAPWIAPNVGTGAFVRDLADMLAARDSAGIREGIAGLRLDAQRLAATDAPAFDRAARLRRALRSALDLLQPSGVDPMWIRDALDAVAAIDPHGDIAFQRAQVQDAVRATVAAFAAADLAPRTASAAP